MLNRNRFTVCQHTFDVQLNGFGNIGPGFLNRCAKRVASRQYRDVSVKLAVIGLYHNRKLIVRHLITPSTDAEHIVPRSRPPRHRLPVSVSHLGQMVANCPPMIEITGWYHEVR